MPSPRRVIRKLLTEAEYDVDIPSDDSATGTGGSRSSSRKDRNGHIWPLLRNPKLQAWAGYLNVNDLESLGAGQDGEAYLVHSSRKVLKITVDAEEAIASRLLIGKNLRNVNSIFKVGTLKKEDPHDGRSELYAILQTYLPIGLNSVEKDAVRHLGSLIMYGLPSALGLPDESPIAWEDPKVRDLADKIFHSRTQDAIHSGGPLPTYAGPIGDRIFSDVTDGLTDLRRIGITYWDVHPGNIRKDTSGNYVILDLGRSATGQGEQIPIIEGK